MTEKRYFSFRNTKGDDFDFELFKAASNDWCVTVITYYSTDTYNIGKKKDAMEFILSYAEEEIEWMDKEEN